MRRATFLLTLLLVGASSLVYGATATITWTLGTEADLAGYRLFRWNLPCASVIVGTTPAEKTVDLGKVSSYVDNTIPDTWPEVCYGLKAVDTSSNYSGMSQLAGKQFAQVPPPAPLLPGPSNVTFDPAMLTFKWTTTPGATKTRLYIHEGGLPYECGNGMACPEFSPTTIQYTANMKWSTAYDCWLTSVNADGKEGEATGIACSTGPAPVPPDTTPPVPPSGLNVVKQTPTEIIIEAMIPDDCLSVKTSTAGSTKTMAVRTIRCVR